MSDPSQLPTRKEFTELVHDALNRLYDSPYLQTHPLGALLISEQEGSSFQRSRDLRRVLLEAIQAVRPAPGSPADSPDCRSYRILQLRYIEGLPPNKVMDKLYLARTQYFHYQGIILAALAATLWDRCQEVASTPTVDATHEELALSEAARLAAGALWQALDLVQVLDGLRGVVEPLAKAKGVSLHYDLEGPLTVPRADRVMVRQAILNVIPHALDLARHGQVDVSGYAQRHEIGLRVAALARTAHSSPPDTAKSHAEDLSICNQLMTAMGGGLHVQARRGRRWEARLAWPSSASLVLLVVDDNQGLIDLFRRYLAGHGWQVLGATNGAEAHRILAEKRPNVIILDLMMPGEDGWELLAACKARDDTRDVPVLICSVLDAPNAALIQGAAGYLPKPVTQQALLQALARVHPASASQGPVH